MPLNQGSLLSRVLAAQEQAPAMPPPPPALPADARDPTQPREQRVLASQTGAGVQQQRLVRLEHPQPRLRPASAERTARDAGADMRSENRFQRYAESSQMAASSDAWNAGRRQDASRAIRPATDRAGSSRAGAASQSVPRSRNSLNTDEELARSKRLVTVRSRWNRVAACICALWQECGGRRVTLHIRTCSETWTDFSLLG
jgi:hypothetical protein